jgi:peptide/nickel transport system ATP-binding protein
MDRLLEIHGLKVEFLLEDKVITAVDGVGFDIYPGEVVVLAGESGSGKTITALSLTRILPKAARITSGSAAFLGKDLLRLDEKALIDVRGKEISYIFQEPTSYLNPVYTIGNQIIEAIMLHQTRTKKEAKREALELLSLVKIKDPGRVFFDYPHQLSGGMNQRSLIAMALACRPKLLIADEPTTALDVTIESEILRLLMELKNSLGFSMLFITHNLSIANRIADRICVMYRGRIVDSAKRDVFFHHPGHPHSRELIEAYEKIGKI